jgi:Domain of unknown function (DUF4837)
MQDKIVKNNSFYHTLVFFIGLFCFSSFYSCKVDMAQLEPRNKSFGQANHMVVIADQTLWDGAVGDTFRYYFSSAYPILPQPEPFFDLQHWTAGEVTSEPIRQRMRTYLVLGDLSKGDSPTTQMILADLGEENRVRAKSEKTFNSTMGKNKWADKQTMVYLFGNSEEELVQNIRTKFTAISQRINEADSDVIGASVYAAGESEELNNKIKQRLGVSIRIPNDYKLAIEDGKTMWLRKETDFISSNIMLQKLEYRNKEQFTKEGIKAIQDSLGRKYVSTEIENTYMRTNDVDLPMLTKAITLNEHYAVEARGIWEIENDFMGGPFISYLIHNQNTNELLFVEGFVHAPGKEKRDYIQQLEYIFQSVKL